MKTLFTYLTMIVLFIIGTRLVTAQQKYTRSRQELAPVAPKNAPVSTVFTTGQSDV